MIVTLRWIYWVTAASVVVIAFFADAYDWILIPLVLAFSLQLLTNFFFGLSLGRRRERVRLENLSEFSKNQEYPPQALEEIFQTEKSAEGLKLASILEGTFVGDKTLLSPLSGEKVLAYKIEVDVFKKTKLGGEADYVPVVTQGHWTDLFLRVEGVSLAIQGPRLFNLGRAKEELITWATLEKRNPELKRLVHDQVQLAGLTVSTFTGVRVRETVLLPEESGRVYGLVQKTRDGLVVRGNDVLDDPGSLLIVTDPRINHKNQVLKTFASPLLNLGLGLLTMALAAGLFFQGPGRPQSGQVKVTSGAKAYSLKFEVEKGDSVLFQTGSTKSGEIPVLDPKKIPFLAQSQTGVTLTQKEIIAIEMHKGLMGYPEYKNGRWDFTMSSEASVPRPVLNRKGPIYLKNLTDQDIRLRLGSPGNRPELQGWWDFGKKAGLDENLGLHLVIGDENFDLSQGDFIQLGTEKLNYRFFVLGVDPEIRWTDLELAWVFEVKPEYLVPREGELWAFNPKAQTLIFKIPDQNTPGVVQSGVISEVQGLTEWVPVKDDKGKTLRLFEGQNFKLDAVRMTIVYRGPLSALPQAKWDKSEWKVDLR